MSAKAFTSKHMTIILKNVQKLNKYKALWHLNIDN